MQNFTLGLKGKSLYLLILTLLIGSLPSIYGQCPDVTDSTQEFCALAQVSDLQATDTAPGDGDDIRWYDSQTDNTPIPQNELLEDGKVYYAGLQSGSCQGTRETVTADVTNVGPPQLATGEDEFFTPCGDAGTHTIGDLKAGIDFEPVADYTLEYFETEFDGDSPALPDGFVLVEGTSYFAGFVNDSDSDCESTRTAIRYDPVQATAPAATSPQTVCQGTTVSELEAEGTNRWYRTSTSQPPLPDDFVVQDGQTYYATQIVPSDGPPCESEGRTAVTVIVEPSPDAGEDNVGVVCEPDVEATFPSFDAVRNFYLSLLEEGVPTDGTFEPTIEEIVEAYNADEDGLGDFTVTYTIGSAGCEDSVELTIRIIAEEPANAGSFDDISGVCAEDEPIDLTSLENNDPDATSGGTFSGEGVSNNEFDPSIGEGEYTITYTVDENSEPCTSGSDSTSFTITVDEANAGDDITDTVCSSTLEDPSSFQAQFASYLEGRDTDGTFDPALEDLYAQYQNDEASGNLPQTYDITYTVTDGSCEDQATISVTVNPSPDAGEDGTANLESTDDPVALFDFLGGTPDEGGTWSPGDGTFDPATDTPGTFTYTVTNSFGCEDSATVTVTVDEECAGVTAGSDNTGVVCETDVQETFPSNDEVRKFYLGLLDSGVPTNGTFNPTIQEIINQYQADEDGLGDFTTTYTISVDGCEDSADLTVSIVAPEPANAGEDVSLSFCTGDEDQNLFTFLSEDANSDGTFEGYPDGIFSPSNEGAGTYTVTYTVDESTGCVTGSDTASFTIEVNEGDADAGEDGSVTLLPTDDPVNLFDFLGGTPDEGGTWSPGDGTFDPATDTEGTFTYTVSDGSCEDSATVIVIVQEECDGVTAGSDNTGVVCESDVQETFPSNDEVRKFYLGLLDSGVPTNGTFNPTIQEIINQYQADEDGLGDFTTTYTISVDGCEDSADLTVSIVAPEPANAGEDVSLSFCTGDEDQNLFTFLSEDANSDGTFEGYPDGIFSPSNEGAGTYTVTYTVDESTGCVTGSDTASFTIEVNEGDADAGEDGSVTLLPTDDPVNLFDFLGGTPDEGGTWSPGDGTFDPATDTEGTFTYTVSDGSCEDSATVTVIVQEECDGVTAGSDNTGVVCESDVQETFPSNDEVRKFYLNLLDTGVSRNGTFNPTIQQIVNQYQADEDGLGDFTTTYTINVEGCEDSAELTIRIIEEGPATAGSFDNIEDVCSDEDPIDLTTLENNDPNATIGGTFTGEGVTNNEFDPSVGAGTYTITYNVDETTPCTTGSDSTNFTITVEDAPISASISRTLCVTDARDLISNPTSGLAYLQGLVEEAGVENFDADNFSDEAVAEAMSLANFIETPTSDSETFDFEYTDPSDSVCDDGIISVSITITDLRDAEAGDIEDQTVCASSGMIDLTDFFTEETVPGGTFTGTGVEDGMFDSSIGSNEAGYEITYTVDDSADCVTEGTSDSTTFIIFVDNSVEAGADNSGEVCRAEVDERFPNNASVRDFYLNLLDEGISRAGTFQPTIQQLIDDYNNNPEQDEFATIYTVTNGVCSDDVRLVLNLFDALPAEIGDITNPEPICRNAEDIDLFSFLPADANPNGTFEGYEDGIFSPGMEGAGSFEITYTLTEDSPCTEGEASATFTVTVIESAYAGQDMELSVCTDEGVQNLFESLSIDADTNGEFTLDGEVIADGMMNPADFEAGEYEVVYTVPAINDCGEDSATFNITVEEAPEAPTVDGNPFTFCATDEATGADLSATGTNLTFYSDEALSMMVAPEDALVAGTYYVTQRNDEGGCESEATEITVNINDAATPTISNTTQEFCEFDDATLADLTELINETGTITWYDSEDGDNALNSGTSLQDGVTYYATLFNIDTGCESSVRLAVTVSINDDCPITIPEAFSPNGDGLNDRFEIRNIRDKYPNFTIEIRNRFGDVVYKGNANTPDWDGYSTEGSFGSDILPVGAYFYYLRYNDGTTEPVRGTVYLSR